MKVYMVEIKRDYGYGYYWILATGRVFSKKESAVEELVKIVENNGYGINPKTAKHSVRITEVVLDQ